MSALSEKHLQAQVAHLRRRSSGSARIVGSHYAVQATGQWTGPDKLTINGSGSKEEMLVFPCRSDLEMRECMQHAEEKKMSSILICAVEAKQISDDLLSRLVGERINLPRNRTLLASYFRVKSEGGIDPRILSNKELLEALVERAPAAGYPPSPSGTLTLDQAWAALFKEVTGQSNQPPGTFALLHWSLDAGALARLRSLPAGLKEAIQEWLSTKQGKLASLMWSTIESDHGADLIPLGYLFEVLFHSQAIQHEAHMMARGQLKALLGGLSIDREESKEWLDAVKTYTSGTGFLSLSYNRQALRARLDQLLETLSLSDRAFLSNESPMGLEQRYEILAQTLLRAIQSKTQKVLLEAKEETELLKKHSLVPSDPSRLTRIEMAHRLVHWLQGEQASEATGKLSECISQYYEEGGWVDRAIHHLRQSESNQAVKKAYAKILKRVGTRTQAESETFATALQDFTQSGGGSGAEFLCIEEVLKRAVVPLAKEVPVLLLVLDGMSMAVFRRLQEQITEKDWNEARHEAEKLPRPVLAAIPSITSVSRRALFLGKLDCTTKGEEEAHFRDNDLLFHEVGAAARAVLFKKGRLREKGQDGLSTEARESLTNMRIKVVGMVVNAIDDHLAGGSQDNRVWDVEDINPLREILDTCREAGRWVILTSDHGHVLDYGTKILKSQSEGRGDRFRAPSGKVVSEEIELSGPRVKAGHGSDKVVTAVSTEVRYGGDKRGYHGGASPQEMVIPFSILTPHEEEALLEGWSLSDQLSPDWWDTKLKKKSSPSAFAPPATKAKKDDPQIDLFAGPPKAKDSLGERLLASEIFLEQMEIRMPRRLEKDKVAELVDLLNGSGGKMLREELATALHMKLMRLDGFVQTAAKVLNIDGYQALSLDNSSQTVTLDSSILLDQFELKP